MMIDRRVLIEWCDRYLDVPAFRDYAPNGLQVEGGTKVAKVVGAVTASLAAAEFAADSGADLLLVHHGMFWKNEPVAITGWKYRRIAALIRNGINMAAYHLPLDAHPECGNNARLAALMGWRIEGRTGEQNLLMYGTPAAETDGRGLLADLAAKLGREPVFAGDVGRPLHKLVWCSGGAQGFFQEAVAMGADAYITGEISEAQYHLARETGTLFVSAGHHATERYGIQALGAALVEEFGVSFVFFDEENPA